MRSTIRSLEGSVGAAVQDQLVSAPEQAVKGALGDGEHDFVRAPCTGGRMNAAVPPEQRLDGARDGLQGGRAGGVVHVAAGADGDERDAGCRFPPAEAKLASACARSSVCWGSSIAVAHLCSPLVMHTSRDGGQTCDGTRVRLS